MKTTGVCRSSPKSSAVLFAVAILFPLAVIAADEASQSAFPQNLAVAITIDSEHLIELYQSVPGLTIIDSRFAEDYALGHIEKSHNLPLARTDCKSLSKLANSMEQAMVFYCNGNAGDASIEAIQIASSCGYKRLFWFRGGFVEWKDKDYPYVIE